MSSMNLQEFRSMVTDTRRHLPIIIGDSIASVCSWCATAALAVIVAVNGSNVVGRYIFGASIAWAEELMLYLMILVVFGGCVAVSWRGAHIRIDALLVRFPVQLRGIVAAFIAALAGALMIAVAYFGSNTVVLLFMFDQRSDALALPIWIPQSVVVGGLALSALVIGLRLIACGAAVHSDQECQ